MRDEYFDALIATGAPIETLPFEGELLAELSEIMDWSRTHCFRRLGICWGASAFWHFSMCLSISLSQNYLALTMV